MVTVFINNFINKLKTNSILKWSLFLVVFLGLFFVFLFRLNNSNNDIPTIKSFLNQDKLAAHKNLTYAIQVDKDMLLTADYFYLDGGIYNFANKNKNIYSYNINTEEVTLIVTADNYISIDGIASSKDWLVWIEVDNQVYDTSDKPFNWIMMAKDLNSGTQMQIDKSEFTSNKYNVPMFVDYVPISPKISDNNILVYSKTIPNGNKIASELICYDLNTKIKKILDRTDDVTEEQIYSYCSIYDNTIAWSKFRQLNDYPYKRFTQYAYSDLYIYNLNTDEIDQLTYDDFFVEPAIYKNKLVAVRAPENREDQDVFNSEIVLFDLKTKKFQTIVDENSPVYLKREPTMYRTRPIINKNYISWQNTSGPNRYIYDYKKNRFLEIYENLEDCYRAPHIKDARIITLNMFDEYVLINAYHWVEEDIDVKSELVKLP